MTIKKPPLIGHKCILKLIALTKDRVAMIPKPSNIVPYTFLQNCVWVFANCYVTTQKLAPTKCDIATVSSLGNSNLSCQLWLSKSVYQILYKLNLQMPICKISAPGSWMCLNCPLGPLSGSFAS